MKENIKAAITALLALQVSQANADDCKLQAELYRTLARINEQALQDAREVSWLFSCDNTRCIVTAFKSAKKSAPSNIMFLATTLEKRILKLQTKLDGPPIQSGLVHTHPQKLLRKYLCKTYRCSKTPLSSPPSFLDISTALYINNYLFPNFTSIVLDGYNAWFIHQKDTLLSASHDELSKISNAKQNITKNNLILLHLCSRLQTLCKIYTKEYEKVTQKHYNILSMSLKVKSIEDLQKEARRCKK